MTVTALRHQRPHFARQWVVAGAAAVLVVSAATAAPGLVQWAGMGWSPQPASPADLPACQTAELAAAHAGYDEWADTMLDPANALPANYEPPDLVVHELASGRVRLRSFVIADLVALLDAAASHGAPLTINSSYRSFRQAGGALPRSGGKPGNRLRERICRTPRSLRASVGNDRRLGRWR